MNNMIERKIRLSDTEEVKEFVRAAGKCDFDIDVCYNRAVMQNHCSECCILDSARI